jgi:ribosomal protein L37AE/L43A
VALTGVTCPECNLGQVLERKGRFGPFYGCSRYPECTRNFKARPIPKPCPSCGTAFLLVRERKAGAFYVCEAEGCTFDEPAGDLDRYPVTMEITEEARQAALAAAALPVPKKRSPRRKAEPPAADGEAGAPTAEGRVRTGRAAGKRPARPVAEAKPRRAPARKTAAAARPKRQPVKK